MKYISISLLTLLIFIMSSCKIIENKSQETINKENEKLSKFIQKQESELKIEMGEPDKVFYDDNGSKFFIYTKKKYSIICERKFEIDKSKTVLGFSSKGCF
jgi:hypothetical protein